jgi:hypothetical protein
MGRCWGQRSVSPSGGYSSLGRLQFQFRRTGRGNKVKLSSLPSSPRRKKRRGRGAAARLGLHVRSEAPPCMYCERDTVRNTVREAGSAAGFVTLAHSLE